MNLKYTGVEKLAKHPAGGNAGPALQFAIECQWPGVPQGER